MLSLVHGNCSLHAVRLGHCDDESHVYEEEIDCIVEGERVVSEPSSDVIVVVSMESSVVFSHCRLILIIGGVVRVFSLSSLTSFRTQA